MKKTKTKKWSESIMRCCKGSIPISKSWKHENTLITEKIKIKNGFRVESQTQIRSNDMIRTIHEIIDKKNNNVVRWCITSKNNPIKYWNR